MQRVVLAVVLVGTVAGSIAWAAADNAGSTSSTVAPGTTEVVGGVSPANAPTTTSTPSIVVATTEPPATSPAETLPPTTTVAPQPITIAFAGDIHAEPPISQVLADGKNPLEFVAPILQRADLAVANLETVVGEGGARVDKAYNFRAPPSLLTAVAASGIDVVSTANNHSFDFGAKGLEETLANITAAGLTEIGSGANVEEAYRPAIVEVRGTKIALIGIAKVGPSGAGRATATRPGTTDGRSADATLAAIRAAKAQAPIVIVFLHWGIELASCPLIADRDFAQAMLDAGASAVIGAHPHVLQGISTPPGKVVAYSMGNFVFYARRPIARRSGVLTVSFSPAGDVIDTTFDPVQIDVQGRPTPLDGERRDAAIAAFEALAPATCR